jgi:hypothetical protein
VERGRSFAEPKRQKKAPPVWHRRGKSLVDVQNPRGASITTTETTETATTERWAKCEWLVVPFRFMCEREEEEAA